jgi:GT2 family glycosyltransferase
MIPNHDWLKRLLAEFKTDRQLAVVSSIAGSLDRSLERVATAPRLTGLLGTDATEAQERPVVSLQASLIRTETLFDIGYLDGDFFQGLEDVDFCLRAQLLGYKVMYAPAASVSQAQPLVRSDGQYWYRLIRNYNYIWAKDIPWPLSLTWLPSWFKTSASLWAGAWREGAWAAPFKAELKTILKIPWLIARRRYIQRRRQLSANEFKHRLEQT